MDIFPEANISRTKQYVGKSNWGNNLLGMIDDLRVYDRRYHWTRLKNFTGDLQQYVLLGGEDPTVTLFWGDEDAGTVTNIDPCFWLGPISAARSKNPR